MSTRLSKLYNFELPLVAPSIYNQPIHYERHDMSPEVVRRA
jgi:hypothetical protein